MRLQVRSARFEHAHMHAVHVDDDEFSSFANVNQM